METSRVFSRLYCACPWWQIPTFLHQAADEIDLAMMIVIMSDEMAKIGGYCAQGLFWVWYAVKVVSRQAVKLFQGVLMNICSVG